ncbi:GTPase HflX [Methylacidimicrobium cyclopophantes]|uniref:GTPase HflX n=1 Tax=Methylacidimicrobium cyclopophantes TaxID=1041766 RepID=A0A5E6M570_9BACT|nr:GTPase HflX [Methylacidimicrobium cyclopophantes]VVM04723.1 GTPase HflX [Methylacidimicrobium cyclopophantes]
MRTIDRPEEKTLLVGLELPNQKEPRVTESLEELGELVRSAGAAVASRAIQRLQTPTSPFYIGLGKAQELSEKCQEDGIHSVIFDDELTPAQSRNLSNVFSRKVLDRTQLILDIFAQRAKTREGKIQIELAQLLYLLPRLTRLWSHLSRQTGGIGTRGPGETQLEVDRRRIQQRIARLHRELEAVRRSRSVQREGRHRCAWPTFCLVGYTNSGKSTLFNRLTRSEVLVEDKLFATLDPTIRLLHLHGKPRAFLTDTVGFIRKLPHDLIDSFRATLEEVKEADLLIHLVDISDPKVEERIADVRRVLEELDVLQKPSLLVWNKIDRLRGPAPLNRLLQRYPGSLGVSARDGSGIEELLSRIESWSRGRARFFRFRLPVERGDLLARLHREGEPVEIRYRPDGVYVQAWVPPFLQASLAPFMVAEHGSADSRDAAGGTTAGENGGMRTERSEGFGTAGDSSGKW